MILFSSLLFSTQSPLIFFFGRVSLDTQTFIISTTAAGSSDFFIYFKDAGHYLYCLDGIISIGYSDWKISESWLVSSLPISYYRLIRF